MDRFLIAPCGMNCALCAGFQRERNKCLGCRSSDENKPRYCKTCIIVNCEQLAKTSSGFCYECTEFPCRRLKQLDKRYSTKYGMSMFENLEQIKTKGLDRFVELQDKRWTCKQCGNLLCVHSETCFVCGSKNKYKPPRILKIDK